MVDCGWWVGLGLGLGDSSRSSGSAWSIAAEQPQHSTGEPSAFAGYRGAPGAGQLTGLALQANLKLLPAIAFVQLATQTASRTTSCHCFLIAVCCGASARKGIGLFFCEHPTPTAK